MIAIMVKIEGEIGKSSQKLSEKLINQDKYTSQSVFINFYRFLSLAISICQFLAISGIFYISLTIS